MASLNLDVDYFDHPKTRRLAGLLGKGSEALPLRLWCYCGKYHAADGRLTGHSAQEVESLAGWWGSPGRCIDALVKVAFLDFDGQTYSVHDWAEHASHIETFRLRAKKAVAEKLRKLRGEKQPDAATKRRPDPALSTGPPPERVRHSASSELVASSKLASSNALAVQCSAVQDEILPGPASGPPPTRRGTTRSRTRVLTDQQEETRRAFGDWWVGVWPRFHGDQLFEFVGSRDGPAILELMRRQLIAWDLDQAKRVAEFYLREPEMYFPEHPLWSLAKRANYYARKIRERGQIGDGHVLRAKPTAAQRGEYASDLPSSARGYAPAGPASPTDRPVDGAGPGGPVAGDQTGARRSVAG